MPETRTPVVFIHGLWLHHSSWGPWVELFRERGYDPIAPGWPGTKDTVEAARAEPDSVAGYGIDDVVDHYAAIIAGLDAPPVLIGHSFGGLMVQRLLGQGIGRAGVAIDAAPIKGVFYLPASALRVAFIALRNPKNKEGTVALTEEQFRFGFGNAVSEEESQELYERWAVASPGKPLFEDAVANFSRHSPAAIASDNDTRGPLLLIAGGQDHTVPEGVTKSTLKQYEDSEAVTHLQDFPDRGHSLALDHGWREVADAALAFLEEQGVAPER